MLNFNDFCPPLDHEELLLFRDDAYFAWMTAPQQQREFWRAEYSLICDLLETARSGRVSLG